jgi:hypothetical protein
MRSIGTIVAAALLALVPAAEATAATYDVHACRTPNGTGVPANGWTATAATLGGYARLVVACPGGGMAIRPAERRHRRDGALLGFEFTAPADTTIVGWRRVVDGEIPTVYPTVSGSPPPWYWEFGEWGDPAGGGLTVGADIACGNCGAFNADWDIPRFKPPLARLFVAMQCYTRGSQDCSANGAHFTLRSVAVHLEDPRRPTIVSASGTLLDPAIPQRGVSYLTMQLRDVGGGLYKARVEADGALLGEYAIDDNQGACRMPFVQPVPCKLSATTDVPVNTTRLADGHHELTVRIFDVTGVNSAVYGPFGIEVDNAPDAPELRCPASADGTLTARIRHSLVRFGGSTWLTGRARGATAARGTRVRALGSTGRGASLRPDGRFRLRVRPTQTGDVTPVLVDKSGISLMCGRPTRVRVRAGVRLTIKPRHLRNGGSITVRGQLRGLPVPRGGKVASVQARALGQRRWATVTVLRSDADGHFGFRYRFRRTFRRTTYVFRAMVPTQRGYQFARGWSRSKRVIVRP